MPKFLLDSDVIIWFLRGRQEAVELMDKLQEFGRPACSAISIAEVRAGVLDQEEPLTSQFLESLAVCPVDRHTANQAGEIIRRYRRKGVAIKLPDAIVASSALINNFKLVTYNKKHYPIEGLELYEF